jgi:PAS domain S-box-containing protein
VSAVAEPARPVFVVAVAAACVAVAVAGLVMMEREWRASPAAVTFLIAIVASAWLSGSRGAAAALAFSLLAYGLLFVTAATPVQDGRHVVRLVFLVVVASYIVWLTRTNAAKTRAAQQASEALRLAIDTMPIMAWSLTPDGRIDFLNRRWLDYSGMSLEQGLRDAGIAMHPDEREWVSEQWGKAMATGQAYEAELRLRSAQGEYRWFLVRTVPLKDPAGNVVKWYGTSTDIHALKVAEQAVEENRRLLESMLQTLPVGVSVTDARGNFVMVNDASVRIWAGNIVERSERLERSRGFWHHSGKRVAAVEWASSLALWEGKTVLNQLVDIETFDGERKTIQNSAAPIRGVGGAIVGAVVVNEDVTPRMRAEKALRESAERLQNLSRRLFTVQEEERRHLARELHDEFGQLLTAISLRLQVAKAQCSQPAWPALDDCAALIAQAGERVRGLALELHPTMLESAGLDGTLRWLAESHGRQGPVTVTVHGQVGRVPNDVGVTAYRVVQEALTNVLRHSGAKKARIELAHRDGRVSVTVADDGAGFDVAAAREKAAAQGHLGLVGMKERVEILGGDLDIISEPGAGTRVEVSLPLRSLSP